MARWPGARAAPLSVPCGHKAPCRRLRGPPRSQWPLPGLRSRGGSAGRSGKASEKRPPPALPPASLQSPLSPPSSPCLVQPLPTRKQIALPQVLQVLPGSRPQVTEVLDLKMAASAVRGAVALRTSIRRPVAFVRKIPWTAASSECWRRVRGGSFRYKRSLKALLSEEYLN